MAERVVVFDGRAGSLIASVREPEPGRGFVVLLHGGGQTRQSWTKSAEILETDGWATIAYDARGHGDSTWSAEQDYSMDGYINDLRAVIDQYGAGRPVCLAGASLGGMTAMMAAGRDPEIAERLVLVDITPRPSVAGVERVKAFMTSHLGGFDTLEDVAAAVAVYNPHRRWPNPDGLRRNVRLGEDGRWRWHWDPAILPEGNEIDKPIVRPEDAVAAASQVTIPTLLIAGGNSDVVSAVEVEEFREVMPAAQVVSVGGAGHMVAGDRNDPFVDAIRTFLDE